METKALEAQFEFKSDSNTDGRISGYGAFYNNVDHGQDVIKQGAFSKINRSIKMLYQHNQLIGKWDIVREDKDGLIVEGNINLKTSLGSDAYELAKAGDLTDLSVGFKTIDYEFDKKDVRHIKKADLYEVSLVSFPCNEKANIMQVKSCDIDNEREFESALRDVLGYSNKQAKHIANYGFKSFMHKKMTGDLILPDQASHDNQELIKTLKGFSFN